MKISKHYHRLILIFLALCLGLLSSVQAEDEVTSVDDLVFPGDPPAHKVVYQFNSADWGYQEHVLFSVSAMLRKYGDNIHIVIVAIGPGIHRNAPGAGNFRSRARTNRGAVLQLPIGPRLLPVHLPDAQSASDPRT